jgi:hypothetical protein
MPRTRITITDDEDKPRKKDAPKTDQIGLFTGDDGGKRASEFTAPVPVVRNTPGGN